MKKASKVCIGCGTGNNGGGGLVAARRLSAWGFEVYMDIPDDNLTPLPKLQLERSLAFGATLGKIDDPSLAIDAYFGFSQRMPLPPAFLESLEWMNSLNCSRLALDIPTGITEDSSDITHPIIHADIICTLAAFKKVLLAKEMEQSVILIADLGIPMKAFSDLNLKPSTDFSDGPVVKAV